MSASIRILPEHLANKIAAGEVVGRPASVVKELMENSLDAEASSLTVVIRDGGTSLIQVTDDGTGMSEEDAALAFARHATSKITTYADLENIRTLGFRGEALASIAAVAQVEMRTQQRAADVGVRIRIAEGGVLERSPDAHAPGTTIIVRNLFYNTPGRRKFLKSKNTEYRHVLDVIQRIALSHSSVSITFVSDEENILHLVPATLTDRAKDLFGEKIAKSVFAFEEQTEFATVGGLLGRPDFARRSGIEQYLFLNNRSIVNRSINHAVFQAYENLLEKGSFPFFALFLTIDPRRVDVNVHPSKMEVKFGDDASVYRLVLSAVRRALSDHDLIPSLGMRGAQNPQGTDAPLRFTYGRGPNERPVDWRALIKSGTPAAHAASISEGEASVSPSGLLSQGDGREPGAMPGSERRVFTDPQGVPMLAEIPTIWQIHNKYLLLPTQEGLMMVDQHAAHERVIYEKTVKRFDAAKSTAQQLLFPQTVELPAGDAALVQQLQGLLEAIGFSLKFFGKTTVIVDGVPADVRPGQEGTILQNILDLYKEDEQNIRMEPRERLAKTFSCKAAIKAGDALNQSEMQSLLDQLFQTEIPYVCPHGRPVIVKLPLGEIDKRFGRTS